MECGGCFLSARAWAVHQAVAHGRPNACVRLCMGQTDCPACCVQFWTGPRLVAHLSKDSEACRQACESWADTHDLEEVPAQRAERGSGVSRDRNLHDLPSVRLPGPLLRAVPRELWRIAALPPTICVPDAAPTIVVARTPVPRSPSAPWRFVLHLFSGRRRRGDLQWGIDCSRLLPCFA